MSEKIIDLEQARIRAQIDKALEDIRVSTGMTVVVRADFGHYVIIDVYDPTDRGCGADSLLGMVVNPALFKSGRKGSA